VIPTTFEYTRATSIDDALAKLKAAGAGGKFIAGGHSLVPLMKLRLSEPSLLIDIARIPGLSGIREKGGKIEIGAATVHHEVATSALLLDKCPALADTAATIGDPQVRNRGTMGGSLAHADPAADWPLVFATLDAQVRVAGPSGMREIKADAFMSAAFTTQLADDEIIESIRVPKLGAGARWGYYKFCRKTGEFPEASAALLLDPQRRVARLFAGALERAPQPLDTVARALAEQGAASADMIGAGLGPAARKLRATSVQRAIAQS
jgi:carbon-monoxide dehydrogenase medium subunit